MSKLPMQKTGMEKYQEWYLELENAGFKRTRQEVGNIDFQHPTKMDYTVHFDWMTFKVSYKATIVYKTTKLDLGKFDFAVYCIKYKRNGFKDLELRSEKY